MLDVDVLKPARRRSSVAATIIVPAYNEEAGIGFVLQNIHRSVDGKCEVLVVDDGSRDATSRVASQFTCGIIRHGQNRGKGEAMKTGVSHASGEYVIFIDADGTYPASAIPAMIDALESSDVVYCCRSKGRENIPFTNRLGNAIFQGMIRHIYGFGCSDYCTGLYGMRKSLLQQMDIASRGFAIEPEIAIKASRMRLKIHEIPIDYAPRLGKAKLCSFKAGFEHLKTIFRLLLWRPPESELISSRSPAS